MSTSSIVFIRSDSIGDNLLAASMLPYLRHKYSQSRITIVCQEHIAELYETCPFIDSVVSFNRSKCLDDNIYRLSLINKLKSINADLVLNSVYSRDDLCDLLAVACGACERIAIDGDSSNSLPGQERLQLNKIYSKLIASPGVFKPELDRHADFLIGLDIHPAELMPVVWTNAEDEAFAEVFFSSNNLDCNKTIILFAGAQYKTRHYYHYGKALATVCRLNSYSVVALGSRDDFDINQQNLHNIGVKTLNLSGKTTLRQSAAILRRCRLAVGAETGLAHLACAVGVPNVIVLGGGHFGRFMPYSALTAVCCLPMECFACNWRCQYDQTLCVSNLNPCLLEYAIDQQLNSAASEIQIFFQKPLNNTGGYPATASAFTKLQITRSDLCNIPDLIRSTFGGECSENKQIGCGAGSNSRRKTASNNRIEPLVTAIVSTYNSECFIRGCLEDLCTQTLFAACRLEIIVVDSASPQNEQEIVREFIGRYGARIRYIRTDTRETVYAAWNRAINMARGRYITNANTDDRHRRDAFELMVKTLESLPEIDLVYADVLITVIPNETFETTTASDSYDWPAWDRTKLLDEGCFIGPQPMWRRSVHDRYGGFDASYVTAGDYEFWLRISQTSNFQHIAQPLGLYLARPDSVEHANEAVKQHENAKIRKLYRDAADQGRLVGLVEQQPLQAALQEAEKLAQRGQLDQAVQQLLNQGIRVDAADPRPYVTLAELLIREGRFQDALEVLPEMPSAVDPALKQELSAICRCGLGDDAAALQAAQLADGRPRALVVLGTLAARQGNLPEAERLFRLAIQTDPSCGSGLLSLGMLLWGQGQHNEAFEAVKQAVTADPLNREAVQILRDMAERLG